MKGAPPTPSVYPSAQREEQPSSLSVALQWFQMHRAHPWRPECVATERASSRRNTLSYFSERLRFVPAGRRRSCMLRSVEAVASPKTNVATGLSRKHGCSACSISRSSDFG
jgi:hypothetical protein